MGKNNHGIIKKAKDTEKYKAGRFQKAGGEKNNGGLTPFFFCGKGENPIPHALPAGESGAYTGTAEATQSGSCRHSFCSLDPAFLPGSDSRRVLVAVAA
ncbi:MAG: hypothetical protein ACI4LH_04030 [Candidatus Heritagella sp.]